MLKKVLAGVAVLLVLAVVVVFVWARSILATDTVRTAIAAQLSSAIGQPVSIGSMGAGLYPRVTVNLGDVRIGEPAGIRAQKLQLGTDFRALLSRQIAHASLRLEGARIELPLSRIATGATTPAAAGAPVEIV